MRLTAVEQARLAFEEAGWHWPTATEIRKERERQSWERINTSMAHLNSGFQNLRRAVVQASHHIRDSFATFERAARAG